MDHHARSKVLFTAILITLHDIMLSVISSDFLGYNILLLIDPSSHVSWLGVMPFCPLRLSSRQVLLSRDRVVPLSFPSHNLTLHNSIYEVPRVLSSSKGERIGITSARHFNSMVAL
jgi:hypothetical protein